MNVDEMSVERVNEECARALGWQETGDFTIPWTDEHGIGQNYCPDFCGDWAAAGPLLDQLCGSFRAVRITKCADGNVQLRVWDDLAPTHGRLIAEGKECKIAIARAFLKTREK